MPNILYPSSLSRNHHSFDFANHQQLRRPASHAAARRRRVPCESSVAMPFLRRRGNMASETDIRRHTPFGSTAAAADDDEPVLSISSRSQSMVPEDSYSLSQQETHQSEPPEHSPEPSASETEQRQNKFRRFSILRYRNASDSQLSLRAKQQAETPPPIPRRRCLAAALARCWLSIVSNIHF